MSFNIITALIFGLFIGTFLNLVIDWLPNSVIRGFKTNQCFTLNKTQQISKLKNWLYQDYYLFIPILSFVLQKGRHKHCNTKAGWRYPAVEFFSGIITAIIVFKFGLTIETGFYLFLIYSLILLFVIDAETQLLPDLLTLPLMWTGFIYQIQYGNLESSVIAAMLGYLVLWVVYWLFWLIRNKEGIGYGDFKLMAALGAWMGWQALPEILLLSSLLALLYVLLFVKFRLEQRLAFGPFLIIGFIAGHYL